MNTLNNVILDSLRMNRQSVMESKSVGKEQDLKKLNLLVKTMKTNIKGIQMMLKKNQNPITVKSTLDACKNADKIGDFGLYKYYSKELKGVSDDDSERLLDVWYQILSDIQKKQRELINEKQIR